MRQRREISEAVGADYITTIYGSIVSGRNLPMAFDRDKFKSLVHYVCWKAGDPGKLGATKLNKVCWMVDFLSYYRNGASITDASYVKRQFGPVPRAITSVVDELQSNRAIVVSEKFFHGYPQRQFHVLRDPDSSIFSEEERKFIDEITRYVCEEHSAKSISAYSHDHVWKAAADGEEMPYFTIFANPVPVSDSVREWALQEIQEIVN
jgi:hypothetical protein